MGFKDKLMKKAAGKLGDNLMKEMETAQKESNDLIKQLNSELHELAELINQVLDSQNSLIKAVISNYKLIEVIAKKQEIEIPKPLTDMDID